MLTGALLWLLMIDTRNQICVRSGLAFCCCEDGWDVDSAHLSITTSIDYCLSSSMHRLQPTFGVIGLHMALCGRRGRRELTLV